MPIGCRFFNDNKAFYKRKNYLCSVRISMVFWQFSFDSMNHLTKRQLKKEIRSRLSIMVACSRLSCGGRNHPNEVVWTFMRFKICLYFWGVFGPWRGSVASHTTDESSDDFYIPIHHLPICSVHSAFSQTEWWRSRIGRMDHTTKSSVLSSHWK